MPPTQRRAEKDDETEDAPETTKATKDGPKIVDGPTGTIVDPNDPSVGTVKVKVNSNVTLGTTTYVVDADKEVEVPNTAEVRAAIAAGHLTLAEGKKGK
jgi:hypothetical protein